MVLVVEARDADHEREAPEEMVEDDRGEEEGNFAKKTPPFLSFYVSLLFTVR